MLRSPSPSQQLFNHIFDFDLFLNIEDKENLLKTDVKEIHIKIDHDVKVCKIRICNGNRSSIIHE